MSCTENESGPFVVFFLPAVVGCLTILLARRWANSQVSGGSTTAVSRRRKIIKDPLIKRPLPPITYKMVPPGSKKINGAAKKGASQALEDDVNGSSKKAGRARHSPSTTPPLTNEPKDSDEPTPPKHIPFPHLPHDGEVLFEVMNFAFTLVAMGSQFLNIYRTVWWLPNSNNTQAMHFHLIDPHLVAFIIAILSRRILLTLAIQCINVFVAPKMWLHAAIAARMFIFGVLWGALAWCTYFLATKYTLIKLFYLCYPAIIYLVLFGFKLAPFLELHNTDIPVLHSCTNNPQMIRDEIEVMRQDFNTRVKKILFNSVLAAYYTSFIPCCFVQSFVYYDSYMCSQQTVFIVVSTAARYSAHLLPAVHTDALHRAAIHLGAWVLTPGVSDAPSWSPSAVWPRGATVSAGGGCYSALTHTAADPLSGTHRRFYMVFKNPSKLLCGVLCLQLSLVLVQICLLFSSIPWHGFLALFLLLFINYYTMFKLVRDYLVAWKVYKAEVMIQDKNNTTPIT